MYYPSEKEFLKTAKKGNLVPVYKEIAADMETPVSAYRKIEGACSFLLESVEGGEKIARYSFLGTASEQNLITPGSFEEIRGILRQYKPVKVAGLPRFHGGLIGYVSYDAVREIEAIPDTNPDELNLPKIQFLLADTLLAFDHSKHKILIISNAHIGKNPKNAYQEACGKIDELEKKLKKNVPSKETEIEIPANIRKLSPVDSNLSKKEFIKKVEEAKRYICAGDIIQIVLSQRFNKTTKANPYRIFRVLRMINPSPYMYYLNFGKTKIIGSSPEVMVRLEGGTATLRPIAGTRPRGKTDDEDKKMEAELLNSKKEIAEHIMLVDLGRNDLGKVCEPGSVRVTEKMVIERYSHVMHIVSNVSGRLSPQKDAIDLLTASFPAGTVTGAPKIRAMEIIDELENTKRGPYAGCVGYFSFSGDLDSAITIRTILIRQNTAYVQAGAGIVADSIPASEYQETVNKARALLAAIELSA